MNVKKAKKLRKLMDERWSFKKDPSYRIIKHEKMRHQLDIESGKIQLVQVVQIQRINTTKELYRQAKKEYLQGELKL